VIEPDRAGRRLALVAGRPTIARPWPSTLRIARGRRHAHPRLRPARGRVASLAPGMSRPGAWPSLRPELLLCVRGDPPQMKSYSVRRVATDGGVTPHDHPDAYAGGPTLSRQSRRPGRSSPPRPGPRIGRAGHLTESPSRPSGRRRRGRERDDAATADLASSGRRETETHPMVSGASRNAPGRPTRWRRSTLASHPFRVVETPVGPYRMPGCGPVADAVTRPGQ
jgi:hypothetical protein